MSAYRIRCQDCGETRKVNPKKPNDTVIKCPKCGSTSLVKIYCNPFAFLGAFRRSDSTRRKLGME